MVEEIPQLLNVEGMTFGGDGLARHGGKVYFIRGALPGQQVSIKNAKHKKNYATAEVNAIVQDCDYRQPSPCVFFEKCGGCQWLDCDYSVQLQWKKSFILDAIQRIGKLAVPDDFVLTPSSQSLFYRQRIRVQARLEKNGRLSFGYFARGSHDLVAIDSCAIASKFVTAFLRKISSLEKMNCESTQFSAEIHDVSPHEDVGQIAITLYPVRNSHIKSLQHIAARLQSFSEVVSCHIHGQKKAEFFVYDKQFGIDYYTRPGCFQQVNVKANRIVRQRVFDFFSVLSAKVRVLDLFCGSGNLSLGLASLVSSLEGVELSADAIATAQYATHVNGIDHFSYYASDAAKFLQQKRRDNDFFDVIITDPPREGMNEAIESLVALKPKWVVYMSCDPNTLARDLGVMARNSYKLRRLEGIDFFPNTFHVESLAFLERDDASEY